MEKLLFLGVDTTTALAVQYARSLGVYTIISDMLSIDSSPVKKLADEVWNIDVKNLDLLEKRCREYNITGVYGGNSEFCLEYVRQLSLRLFGDFHASTKSWNVVNDKDAFKDECRKVGIDVPKRYDIPSRFDQNYLSSLNYPVIVKPSDSSASQGLTLCRRPEELEAAYGYALDVSPNKKVVIEDFIDGEEFAAYYFFVGGDIYQVNFTQVYSYMLQDFERIVCSMHSLNKRQLEIYREYRESVNDKAIKLLRNLGCTDGMCFMQMKYLEGKFYFLEAAMRLPGLEAWTKEKELFGVYGIDFMVDLSLHKDLTSYKRRLQKWSQTLAYPAAEYYPAVRAGKISQIVGLDLIKAMNGVSVALERFREDDLVGYSNSMYQIPYYMLIGADSHQELMDKFVQINQILHIYDTEGEEMLMKFYPFADENTGRA